MHVDIVVSLLVYTLATIAFYLLGAGVLHSQGLVPRGSDLIVVLSRIYTETLGPWALWVFYAGAIVTLYGTIFAATAAHARIYADLVRLLGAFAREDYAARSRYRRSLVWALTLVPVALYLPVRVAGEDGGHGRFGAVVHVAGVRVRHRLSAAPPAAARAAAPALRAPGPLGWPPSSSRSSCRPRWGSRCCVDSPGLGCGGC